MNTDFRDVYSEKNDDELLRLAVKRNLLPEQARYALDAEMRSRGFLQSELAQLAARGSREAQTRQKDRQ